MWIQSSHSLRVTTWRNDLPPGRAAIEPIGSDGSWVTQSIKVRCVLWSGQRSTGLGCLYFTHRMTCYTVFPSRLPSAVFRFLQILFKFYFRNIWIQFVQLASDPNLNWARSERVNTRLRVQIIYCRRLQDWRNNLTPWSRVLPEKLTGSQLVKELPTFYGWSFAAFTSARRLSLSRARAIQ